MQENNFEKQVQQKTGELKLQPSEEVWKKVAEVIARKKNDRRVFAIILLLFLFIGSAIFILWDNIIGTKTTKAISAQINPTTTKQEKEQPDETNSQSTPSETESSKIASKKLADQIITSVKDITGKKDAGSLTGHIKVSFLPKKMPLVYNQEQINNDKKHQEDKQWALHTKNKFSNTTKGKTRLSITSADAADLVNENISDAINKTKIIQKEEIKTLIEKQQVIDTVSKKIVSDKEKIPDIQAAEMKMNEKNSAVKKKSHSKQKNKWEIGFNISLGASATQNGYLGIISSESKAVDTYASYPGQSNGNPAQVQYNSSPSKIKMGLGFVAGLFILKDISPRISFHAGLNYKIYSSRMKIGNRIDSSPNLPAATYYYRAGNTTDYKNDFHFLELPIAVRYRLGMQTKLPLYINAGISVSRLIGLRALQFDPLSGTYYKKDALFNKTQFTISAGLLFSLSGAAKNALLIGPDMNVGLSKMAGAGLYENRHYNYFGILLQKTIGKN